MNKKQKQNLRKRFSSGLKSSAMMISTLEEWHDAKHRDPSKDEIDFINSIEVPSCPYCGSARIRKDGRSKKTGLAIRECKGCGRKFNPLAGTVFDSRKIPISEWVEYLAHAFEFHSTKTSASDSRNAGSTGRYWRDKVFLALDGCQEGIVLSGAVWIDEIYFPKWRSETELSGGKRLRGLSRNQLCVATMTDGKACVLVPCGVGHPSARQVLKAYAPHIKRGSRIFHDGDASHDALIEELGLESAVRPTAETKGLRDSANPMEPINKAHRYLKGFMSAHGGFSRESLPGWLNLFSFYWNAKGDVEQKAQAFIDYAVKKRKKMRYRAWGKAKKKDGN